MKKPIPFQKSSLIFGIPLLIIGVMILLVNSALFKNNPNELSLAITFDILLTVPFVYYLLIRKTTIPKTTVVPFFILGLVICSFLLPSENQNTLNVFKTWVLPIVEIVILAYVIFNVRKGIIRYKLKKEQSVDFYTALKSTCSDLLPQSMVIPFVTEIAVFYYGFINWRKRTLKANEFSYHKNSGTISILMAILLVVAIETVVFHILLAKWSTIAAWVFTCLSIYTGFQIFGFLKSMLKRPIAIKDNTLYLRYGIMGETTIDLQNIASIQQSKKDLEDHNLHKKLSFLGELEGHNIIIGLKKETTLTGLYGIKRNYTVLAFYVDNDTEFYNQITDLITQ